MATLLTTQMRSLVLSVERIRSWWENHGDEWRDGERGQELDEAISAVS